ncbi:hypothetical protein CBER1_10789 [Cercospora berteroae]|uniref:Uncharacterized protein n=1 Tax=Cercospora berteroae TaxID=357750 RepID=A0A2S6BZ29_9PEZI|nr:hypothetical protein CBER1_10789 [Cercospora berteroae]
MLGNIGLLGSTNADGNVVDEDTGSRTANGLIAIELAVLFEQPAAVRWLIDRGATSDVVSLWDVDWKFQAKQLIEQQPHVVGQKAGPDGATALRIAVKRDDQELAIRCCSARLSTPT